MADLNLPINGVHHRGAIEEDKDDETIPLQPPVTHPQDLPAKATQSKERVWVVFRCSFIASMASILAGMAGAFTSQALLELSNENKTIPTQYFNSSSILPSVFGVSYEHRYVSKSIDA